MNDLLVVTIVTLCFFISVSSLDDAFIDLMALGISLTPFRSGTGKPAAVPRTAVFVANWQEEDVIGRMVEGNLARIDIPEVSLFLGVYPNDTGTRAVAEALAAKYPDRVRVIVNSLPGPTSKGQMLNEMFSQVFAREDAPELAVLHDSEDVIDPRSFEVYARLSKQYDFIQVPVFSLNRGRGAHVASTYMEEFAERHTREMIVRNALGAAIPSAGVGTCVTKALVRHFLTARGRVLMPGTVTEDYILGIEAKRAGFKSTFAAVSAGADEGNDYVATREFFPRDLKASIKQKTRWVYGIDFEAMHKLGWKGSFWDVYFLIRDRKGAITNLLPPLVFALLLACLLGYVDFGTMSRGTDALFQDCLTFNLFMSVIRYASRIGASYKVYGTLDWFGVLIRWPLSLYINMVSTWRAWATYLGESEFATKPIVWSKTAHHLPENFETATR
ncbi:glycosyl transferase family protein [Pseudomonas sp. R2.Fl]|nr:glycosyl transferase family protein [Pseudomonas sp. R2.Fl]